MLFSALVLVSIDCEHDSLEEGINLCHCDETAEVCNMSRFRLQEEKQVAVFLRLLVVGEEAFLDFSSLVHVTGHFFSLLKVNEWYQDYAEGSHIPLRAPYDSESVGQSVSRDT
jgi:hypothetical protein